jgi:hypothetical protein
MIGQALILSAEAEPTAFMCPESRLSGHVNRISLSVSELATSRFSKAREEITQLRTT